MPIYKILRALLAHIYLKAIEYVACLHGLSGMLLVTPRTYVLLLARILKIIFSGPISGSDGSVSSTLPIPAGLFSVRHLSHIVRKELNFGPDLEILELQIQVLAAFAEYSSFR